MPHLVATIRRTPAQSVGVQLEQAFMALAPVWRAHYSKTPAPTSSAKGWKAMARMVRDAAAPINLAAACAACPLIQKQSERPEEVFHGLGHMEILLAAIERFAQPDLNLMPEVCAPTQQSSDDATDAQAGGHHRA
ncbi:MAG: hypothetical protein WBD40_18710 [Tepidisphaeraceae bacterium]